MHTNAFRSPQDKAWKGLPHGKNVSSSLPREAGVRPTPLPSLRTRWAGWRSVLLLLGTFYEVGSQRAAVASSSCLLNL